MINNRCFCGLKKCNKHRYSKDPFYRKWTHIRSRCLFKWDKDYRNYGARGIKFEWKSYMDFRNDMFASYEKHCKKFGNKNTTIERIDNNGNYCKKNCGWATVKEQINNTRVNKKFTLKGKTQTVSQWAEKSGISKEALAYRLKHGLNIKEAITLKINHGNKYATI